MATPLDTKLLPVVKSLLDTYGATVSYTRNTATASNYDPATGSVTTSETVVSVKILPPETYALFYEGTSGVRAGDLRTGVAASGLGFVPVRDDRLVFNGDTFTVVRVEPVASGDSIVLYLLQLRK
jgi:hypothetical protein